MAAEGLGEADARQQPAERVLFALEIGVGVGERVEVAELQLFLEAILPSLALGCLAELVRPPCRNGRIHARRAADAPELRVNDIDALFASRWHVLVALVRAAFFRQDRYGARLARLHMRQAFGQRREIPFDIAAQECRQCRRAALVRDVRHLDAGSLLDQCHRKMVVAARGTAGNAHAAGSRLGALDKLLQRLELAVRRHEQHELGLDEPGDRRYAVDDRRRTLHDRRREHRRGERQQRVFVAALAEHEVERIRVAGTGPVLDDDRDIDDFFVGHDLCDRAHDHVGRTAGAGADGDFDRTSGRTHLLCVGRCSARHKTECQYTAENEGGERRGGFQRHPYLLFDRPVRGNRHRRHVSSTEGSKSSSGATARTARCCSIE